MKSAQWNENTVKKLGSLLGELKRRDPYHEGHVRRACFYALGFGYREGLSEKELRRLELASFFHDIGKAMIPAQIINKKTALTLEEYEVMKTHSELGEKICIEMEPLQEIAMLVACHHERPNGTGYPRQLKGDEIPELSRIMAVIDVYDSLRSRRSYKNYLSQERSLEIVHEDAVRGNLDKRTVTEFTEFIGERKPLSLRSMSQGMFRNRWSHTATETL